MVDLDPESGEQWRRWFEGPARLREGAHIARSELAAVVIGFRAREDLAAALASLRAQPAVEIVVVNTGGGPVAEKLGPHLEHVRLIEVEAPLLVGAARNIGIDASHAPHVAFLAGDCLAAPGWVAERLATHRAGARAVASAVAPPVGAGYWCRAAHLFLFGTRAPRVPAALARRYGASYERGIFTEFGYFNPALRIGEDSEFANRLSGHVPIEWNPRVVTIHGAPSGPLDYLHDLFARGRRSAPHQPMRRNRFLGVDFHRLLRRRTALALETGKMLQLPISERRRLAPALRLAALAYVSGVIGGFVALDRARADLRRSREALAHGNPAEALRYAERAAAGNGEDVPTLLHLADLLRRDPGGAPRLTLLLHRLGWLCAFDEQHRQAFSEWLRERDMPDAAANFAAQVRLGTPRVEQWALDPLATAE